MESVASAPASLELCGCLVVLRSANPASRTHERRRGGEGAALRALDCDFDLAPGHGQRHMEFGTDRQALPDGIDDIRFSLGVGLPLADTTRDRRAFGDERAVFVLIC